MHLSSQTSYCSNCFLLTFTHTEEWQVFMEEREIQAVRFYIWQVWAAGWPQLNCQQKANEATCASNAVGLYSQRPVICMHACFPKYSVTLNSLINYQSLNPFNVSLFIALILYYLSQSLIFYLSLSNPFQTFLHHHFHMLLSGCSHTLLIFLQCFK